MRQQPVSLAAVLAGSEGLSWERVLEQIKVCQPAAPPCCELLSAWPQHWLITCMLLQLTQGLQAGS